MSSANVAMTAEKWQQIKQVFDEALNQPLTKRPALVRQMCNGDLELELEVQRLLGANETAAASFLETPVVDLHGYLNVPANFASFAPDTVIAERFEILRFLNRGGMGEVYEAWDSELKERVALKTIRPGFAFDAAVIARFKREVKQARGISHPNVCRVYELFSHEAGSQRIWFLSMELLEGPTLLERIRYQGPMDQKIALRLVEQMVSGLAAAHALGVVHRDFKSSNVMLVPATGGHDRAVITDFGLALNLFRPGEEPPEPAGQGTPDYMAPEQRETGEVSFLADQYALGVVMCEMLTACLPARNKQSAPDDKSARLAVALPDHHLDSRWEPVITRCLQIRPEDRFEHIADVMTALVPPKKLWSHWQVGAIAALILILVVATLLPRRPPASRVNSLAQLTPATDLSDSPSLSRDGKLVAYMSDRADPGNVDIFVQQLPDGGTTQITKDPAEENNPSISPEGTSVVYRSERNGGGIYLSSTAGWGEHLLEPAGRNPRFSPDGRHIVYWVGDKDLSLASGSLYLIPIAGGTPVRLAADFIDARLPIWSSDGRFILFLGCRAAGQPMPACSDWWVTTPTGSLVQNTGALAQLTRAGITPLDVIGEWHGDNLIFTGQKGPATSLWELRLPPAKLRPGAAPEPLTSGEATESNPSLADNNTIAFSHVAGALHIRRIDDALHASPAAASNLTGNAATDRCPYISRNGRWLVFARGYGKHSAIWIKDIQSGIETPFFVSDQDKFSPIVDESGQTVVFEVSEKSIPSIYKARRGKPTTRLCYGCSDPTGWFDGDRAVFYREGSPSRIKLADINTEQSSIAVEEPGSSLAEASWSPENQYLLFTKEQAGGRRQVFALPFSTQPGHTPAKWIPITGASEWSAKPRWSGDGRNVFYLSTRDGFSCIWGQHFDPATGKPRGRPFHVMHYHNFRNSIGNVFSGSFNLSVAGNAVYFNLGESNSSIWTGVLKHPSKLSRFK